ncbi:hypothetical protein IC582_022556 [Cucumis melo]
MDLGALRFIGLKPCYDTFVGELTEEFFAMTTYIRTRLDKFCASFALIPDVYQLKFLLPGMCDCVFSIFALLFLLEHAQSFCYLLLALSFY